VVGEGGGKGARGGIKDLRRGGGEVGAEIGRKGWVVEQALLLRLGAATTRLKRKILKPYHEPSKSNVEIGWADRKRLCKEGISRGVFQRKGASLR